MQQVPREGFMRVSQIIGDRENPGPIPVSRAHWYKGVKAGRYPAPVKLSERVVAWRASDIRKLIEELGGGE